MTAQFRISLALAAGITGIALAGCDSATTSTATLSKASIEQGVKDTLTKSVGKTPTAVSCTSDLPATPGASERCNITDDKGVVVGATVTLRSVDSGSAVVSVAVDTTSPAASASDSGSSSSAPAHTDAATPTP